MDEIIKKRHKYENQIGDIITKACLDLDPEEYRKMLEDIRLMTNDPEYEEPTENLSFGDAIEWAKAGQKIQRAGWNGKGQYVELAIGLSYVSPAGQVVNAQHEAIGNAALAFVGTSGVQIGWLASQADMLANDWRLVNADRKEDGDKPQEQSQEPVWICPFCRSAYIDDMTEVSCRKGMQTLGRNECRGFKPREKTPSGGG